MSQTLKKRGRQTEALLDSMDVLESKRFDCEETDRFIHLLQLDKTLAYDEEECAPSEELLDGVMRTLEDLIAATCSTSYLSNSGNNLVASDISSGHEGQTVASDSVFDLCYLLEASDDELCIPASPVAGLTDEIRLSSMETSEGLWENLVLVSIGENWHFQDDFENNLWVSSFENSWDANQLQDYLNRGFVSQGLLFEEDFLEAWRQETASCL